MKISLENKIMLDVHYAMIFTFHNGNPESYVSYFQQKIKHLERMNEPTFYDYKINEYKKIIEFVIAYIPRKIKWHQLKKGNNN